MFAMCLVAMTAQAQVNVCMSYGDLKANKWKPYEGLIPGKEPDSVRVSYDGQDYSIKTADKECNRVIKKDVFMATNMSADGTKEDPYYNDYLLENGDDFLASWVKGQEMNFLNITKYYAEGSGSHLSWNNTYRTTQFDKATGWSNWMKKNPGIPFDNPPYDDQYTYVFEKPTWSELTEE